MEHVHFGRRRDLLSQTRDTLSLARALVRCEHTAEDLVQDAWVSALEAPEGRVRDLRSWLRSVARYCASGRLRREGLRLDAERAAARADIDLVREPGSLEERLLHDVARLARELEEPYGTVIRKRFFDRRSLAEIASELDRPLGTVHSQAKRGLERLRERMERPHGRRWLLVLGELFGRAPTASTTPTVQTALTPVRLSLVAAVLVPLATLFGLRSLGSNAIELGLIGGTPSTGAEATVLVGAVQPTGRVAIVTARSTGELIVTAIPERGASVDGVSLRIEPVGTAGASDLPEAYRRTFGAALTARFEELEPGTWRLIHPTGPELTFTIRPAEVTRLSLSVARGVEINGQVLGQRGHPLGGAKIFATRTAPSSEPQLVARTTRGGHFRIPRVHPTTRLHARFRGAVSPRYYLGAPRSDPDRAELVLQIAPHTRLHGTVYDAEGAPISGARVEFEPVDPGLLRQTARGHWALEPAQVDTASNEHGHFQLDAAVVDGTLHVAASGHSPARLAIPAQTSRDGAFDIALPATARAVGMVRDGSYRPVPDVRVVLDQGSLPPRSTRTDDAGRFAFEDLAPGPFVARFWREGAPSSGESVPESCVLAGDLSSGETRGLEPQLGLAATLWGTLVDERGEPLASHRLSLVDEEQAHKTSAALLGSEVDRETSTKTDTRGRFAFPARADSLHTIAVRRAGSGAMAPLLEVEGLRPGHPARIQVEANRLPSARLSGTVRPREGSIQPHTELVVWSEGMRHALRMDLDVENGRFLVDGLPHGEAQVRVWSPDRPAVLLARVQLRRGEHRSLGVLEIPELASLTVRVLTATGTPAPPSLRTTLVGRQITRRATSGTACFEALPPREPLVLRIGKGGLSEPVHLILDPGEQRMLEHRLAPPDQQRLVTERERSSEIQNVMPPR